MKRIIYDEFKCLITSYFKTLSFREFLFDIGIPILIGICFLKFVNIPTSSDKLSIVSQATTLISIFLGFTVASLAIILTSNSTKIKEAKQTPSDKKIKKIVNLYQLLLIPFFYISFISFVELMILITTSMLSLDGNKSIIAINLMIIFHILLVGMRNLTNLFFILFNEK